MLLQKVIKVTVELLFTIAVKQNFQSTHNILISSYLLNYI
jgi:hypothetical protein